MWIHYLVVTAVPVWRRDVGIPQYTLKKSICEYEAQAWKPQDHVIFSMSVMCCCLFGEALHHSRACRFFCVFCWALIRASHHPNTRLRHRWSARPTGSWTRTIHWRLIPTLRLQLRQRWKWSTRLSTCHTPTTPALLVHLLLPLIPALLCCLSLSLSHFLLCCYLIVKASPPPAVLLLLPLFSLPVWAFDFYCCLSLCSSLSETLLKEQHSDTDYILNPSWCSFSHQKPESSPLTCVTLAASEDVASLSSSLTVLNPLLSISLTVITAPVMITAVQNVLAYCGRNQLRSHQIGHAVTTDDDVIVCGCHFSLCPPNQRGLLLWLASV